MRQYTTTEPKKLEPIDSVSYRYNYHIEEQTISAGQDGEEQTQWASDYVVLWEPLTADNMLQAVISDRWPADVEQKLRNEYDSAELGLYGDAPTTAAEKQKAYTKFLTDRIEQKELTEADAKELGIE